MAFLNDFIAGIPLTDAHRSQLQNKRGFYDKTIDSMRLRSCGPHLRNDVWKFAEKDLRRFKFIDDKNQINPQLVHSNVLIPYSDSKGNIFKVRPHKYGLKGDGVHIYSEHIFDVTAEELILTEGEFKAIAGWQYGFNTIAVPGITSFSRHHFEELKAFIETGKVKIIYVMFDSETKDNPEFTNYKQDWKNRYDTEIYSYIMGKKILDDTGIECKIATLPRS